MQVILGKGDVKPDVLMKINSDTFNDLCDHKISGFQAFVTKRLEFEGKLFKLKKWQSHVVEKYLNHVDIKTLPRLNQ